MSYTEDMLYVNVKFSHKNNEQKKCATINGRIFGRLWNPMITYWPDRLAAQIVIGGVLVQQSLRYIKRRFTRQKYLFVIQTILISMLLSRHSSLCGAREWLMVNSYGNPEYDRLQLMDLPNDASRLVQRIDSCRSPRFDSSAVWEKRKPARWLSFDDKWNGLKTVMVLTQQVMPENQ